MEFQKDVVIDLVCFRRLGHNEQDEPMVTQPLMYKIISQHPGTRKLYADRLVAQGVIRPEEAEEMIKAYRTRTGCGLSHQQEHPLQLQAAVPVNWERFRNAQWNDPADTGVPLPS